MADPTPRLYRRGMGRSRDVDMTFSVSKTFLSSVAGIAFDKG